LYTDNVPFHFLYIMLKKLKRLEVQEKLIEHDFELFTPREFCDLFDVSRGTASLFINTNLRSGLFVKLRNGFYIVKQSYVSNFFIANRLYQPSYVSLNTALSHYGIIPEVVYTTTSVTTKITREYETPKGDFSYRRIKKEAFTGYGLQIIHKDKVLIAEPEKALADYLYFVDLKRLSLNDRLELRNINKSALIAYAKIFQRPGMLSLIKHIYVEYQKPGKIY